MRPGILFFLLNLDLFMYEKKTEKSDKNNKEAIT